MNKLVTVVVPVFNGELYLEKCINSILQQDYNNFELIIIDDGSTDGTYDIIKKFSNDSRIKAYKIANSGVSNARNVGIDKANGDYITFIDADDYISPDFISYMLSIISKNDSDYAFSFNCFSSVEDRQIENDTISSISKEDAIAAFLSPEIIVGCWNKIYKTSFLNQNNIRFLTELFYGEGLYFINNVARLGNGYFGEKRVYYYRRNNEMSATTKFNINKLLNGEKSLNLIYDHILIHSKKEERMWLYHMTQFSLGAVVRILTAKKKKEYKNDYKRWKKIVNKNSFKIAFYKELSLYRKLLLLSCVFFPRFLVFLDKKRRNKIVKNSV